MTAVRDESCDALRHWITTRVALYARVLPADIDVQRPLAAYGLDSVYALTLAQEIEETFGVVLEPTTIWDVPSIAALAAIVHAAHVGRKAPS